MNFFVIDVGGTFVKYAVMDEMGGFLDKGKFPTITDDRQKYLDSVESRFHSCCKEYGEMAGIAISMAGILDVETGYAFSGGAVECVSGMNIVDYFTDKCGVPVTIENDAKAAAEAEMWRGNLKDVRDGVVIVIGTAIGGAVIVDRSVVRGKDFFAGEFSYIIRKEPLGPGFENSWGTDGGVRGLVSLMAEKKGIPAEELDGIKAFEFINSGDEEAMEVLRAYCAGIATRIWNLHCILNPDRVLIGGGISAQPVFIKTVQEEVEKIRTTFPVELAAPEVMECRFFNDSNLIGALFAHLSARKML
ncbi:MAG: ROK family protein [Lachnospiraceae bacterium]|nr:ROK family protein [Lachnospiraceae bacterium]